jgi:heme-degrading monooxygenase HmoA
MYIAMNRFRIRRGEEAAFEALWLNRESRLSDVPGFRAFVLLKGPEHDDHTLYASHTHWVDRSAFEAWTHSDAFRQAHKNAGDSRGLYLGHPEFEGFAAVQGSEETAAG